MKTMKIATFLFILYIFCEVGGHVNLKYTQRSASEFWKDPPSISLDSPFNGLFPFLSC